MSNTSYKNEKVITRKLLNLLIQIFNVHENEKYNFTIPFMATPIRNVYILRMCHTS